MSYLHCLNHRPLICHYNLIHVCLLSFGYLFLSVSNLFVFVRCDPCWIFENSSQCNQFLESLFKNRIAKIRTLDSGRRHFFSSDGIIAVFCCLGMDQHKKKQSKRLDLQGIRALAIIVVLGFHFYPEYCPNGYLGVDQ